MKKGTKIYFVEKSQIIHNNKYDYSLVVFTSGQNKVKIICPNHGVFEQRASAHMDGQGCNECKKDNRKIGINNFLIRANIIHQDKFDYSLVIYKNSRSKIDIICPKHGVFQTTPDHHLNRKQGCPSCKSLDKNEFIDKSKKTHGDKYDYSKVVYTNNKNTIEIGCPKHGLFKQRAQDHLKGHGCPICNESKGEKKIREFLTKKEIKFIYQKKFKNCKDIRVLSFDFYLPNFNLCIEFNGEQHYKQNEHFGGAKKFNAQKIKDKIKSEYCLKNNIELFVIKFDEDIENKLQLLFDKIAAIS